MTNPEKRIVATRWFEEYFTKGHVDVLDELTTEDFVFHSRNGEMGRNNLKDFMGWFRKVFHEDKWVLEDFIEQDDKLVVRYTGWFIYKGGWLNIPSTDQQLKETGIMIYKFENGKVKELWCENNDVDILNRLGALPKNA